MARAQVVLRTVLWALLVVTLVATVAVSLMNRSRYADAQGSGKTVDMVIDLKEEAPRMDLPATTQPAPHFQLIDQFGKPFTLNDLRGKPWVASFLFTRCTGPCPTLAAKVADLHLTLGSPEVQLVTFTVDPEHDKPEVLLEYAKRFYADEPLQQKALLDRWHLLTGDKEAIYQIAKDFKLGVEPAQGDQPIIHSTKLVLINAEGQVVAYYDSTQRAAMHALHDAVDRLHEQATATSDAQ